MVNIDSKDSPMIPAEGSVNVLGENGIAYNFMQISFFLFPIIFFSFVWFVFFYRVDPEDVPLPIVFLGIVGLLIFAHQKIDMYRRKLPRQVDIS